MNALTWIWRCSHNRLTHHTYTHRIHFQTSWHWNHNSCCYLPPARYILSSMSFMWVYDRLACLSGCLDVCVEDGGYGYAYGGWRTYHFTCYFGKITRAFMKFYIGAIATHHRVYLGTESTGPCQTPFSARCPITMAFRQLGIMSLAHNRIQLETGFESSVK